MVQKGIVKVFFFFNPLINLDYFTVVLDPSQLSNLSFDSFHLIFLQLAQIFGSFFLKQADQDNAGLMHKHVLVVSWSIDKGGPLGGGVGKVWCWGVHSM